MYLKGSYGLAGIAVFIALSSAFGVAGIYAQTKSLDRDLEPVIMPGSVFPEFSGVPVSELFLFAYRSGVWEQIPFQIDEKDASGSFFVQDETVGLDANDELVFMAKDAGDQAFTWIDDIISQGFLRYEIKITDPLDSGKMAWVYLYRSNTLALVPNLTDYVTYFESKTGNAGEDTVRSLFYEIAHFTNGFPKDLIIPTSAGGNGQDLLDIIKFRAKARLLFTVNITEESIVVDESQGDLVRFKDGLVRVIREIDATLNASVLTLSFSTPPAFYYPYSTSIDIRIPDLSPASVSSGRMSFDLNANASNPSMKFVSANNPEPGFMIDGVPETPQKEVDSLLPDNNWIYINGNQGTIVHLFPFSTSVGGSRSLFYNDNSAVDDGDTGDKMSFGDTGIDISGGINPPFTLSYKGYFLDKDRDSSTGSQVARFERNPLQTDPLVQDFSTVPVELTSFTATVEKNDVHLVWTTATETNNFGFDVERQIQGTNQWTKIAFVPGNGTTTNPIRYDYFDRGLSPGVYEYRLKQIDTDGSFEYHDAITAVVGLPQTFVLYQNFPNPFNPSTEIQYELPGRVGESVEKMNTILKIYNLLGQEVRTLVNEIQAPGYYKVAWNGTDNFGQRVPSGVYIYRLQAGDFVNVKKMVLVQ
jgi:hypothetical protein